MYHFLIGFALVVFFAMDVVFVNFSNTPTAALAFGIISFLILALVAILAGGFGVDLEAESIPLIAWLLPNPLGSLVRTLAAAAAPTILVVVFTFLPDLEDLIANIHALQITMVFSLFWIMASLALVGVVLGFIWPRTGLFEAVLAGTLVVLMQGLVTWVKVSPPWESLELALFNLMIWVSICLGGAWVGVTLRDYGDSKIYRLFDDDFDQARDDKHTEIESESAEEP